MKKASYTIVTKPYFISLECPHCDWTVEIYYEDALKIANNYYDLWAGNAVVVIECDMCGKEIELTQTWINQYLSKEKMK